MNTSPELISSSLPRHHGGDRPTYVAPKSFRRALEEKLAREHMPTVAVTGTSGEPTVEKLVAHVAEYMDVPIDTATTLSKLVRRGLRYEEVDAAVFLDASEHRVDDTSTGARPVRSLLAERVRDGGTLILNADDPTLRALRDSLCVNRPALRVVLFSLDPRSPAIHEHREAGGLAYVLEGGWIIEVDGAAERRVVRVRDLPMSGDGAPIFPMMNVVAAVAAARAVGFGVAEIACGLNTFESP